MASFQDYLRVVKKVEGWLEIDAARVLDYCHFLQRKGGLSGHLCEIGVHHGRTTLLLATFIKPEKERLIVNDVFDRQEFNISTSGYGSETIFRRNLARLFKETDFLTVIKKPSEALTLEETTANCRIFVVDGGHTAKETYNDLQTAKRALLAEGIIMIDDYFTYEFPGVSEGVCRFLIDKEDIIPWIFCCKQLFLIRKGARSFYDALMAEHGFDSFCRKNRFYVQPKTFFGQDLLVIRKPSAGIQHLIYLVEMKARRNPRLFARIKGAPGFSWLRKLYQKFYRPK